MEKSQAIHALREKGVSVQVDYQTNAKLEKAMQKAHRLGAKFVAVIGDRELNSGTVSLKEMHLNKTYEGIDLLAFFSSAKGRHTA